MTTAAQNALQTRAQDRARTTADVAERMARAYRDAGYQARVSLPDGRRTHETRVSVSAEYGRADGYVAILGPLQFDFSTLTAASSSNRAILGRVRTAFLPAELTRQQPPHPGALAEVDGDHYLAAYEGSDPSVRWLRVHETVVAAVRALGDRAAALDWRAVSARRAALMADSGGKAGWCAALAELAQADAQPSPSLSESERALVVALQALPPASRALVLAAVQAAA